MIENTIQYAVAAFLAVHGSAHIVAFAVSWRLADLDKVPYSTRLLAGRIDVGDAGVRLVGVFWLVAALGFFATAAAVAMLAPWWFSALLAVTAFSLILCIAGYPHSKIGLFVDIAILAVVAIGWISGASLTMVL